MIRPSHCVMQDSSSRSTAVGACPSEELRPGAYASPMARNSVLRAKIGIRQVKRSTLYTKIVASLLILWTFPTLAADNFAINNATGTFTILKSTDDGAGAQQLNTITAPSSSSTVGIVPTVSSSAGSSLVVCSAPCNSWSAYVTTGAVSGYLLGINATSTPVDGAVTPLDCIIAPANQTVGFSNHPSPADRYSVGLTLVFSTTGCFTKTASATAFFKAKASQ